MSCTLLTTATAEETLASLDIAAKTLVAGGLLAFATETVYGLGADALNDSACTQIFAAKGRPSKHPLIVHISSQEQALTFASHIPDFAHKLIAAFWPGPLTLILPRKPGVARAAAGLDDARERADSDNPTIGLRCPAHPLALALLQTALELGVAGVAAPSANRFGRISPTTAQHVVDEFHSRPHQIAVLDGGACSVGIESTIVDCSRGQPVLLRPGHISRAQIEAVTGLAVALPKEHDASTPKAAGSMASHYAPVAKLRIVPAAQLEAATQKSEEGVEGVKRLHLPNDFALAEHVLFARLRELDQCGVREIWVSAPPEGVEWDGVRDRLQRAAY